jgi:release factor glutamine methyltransferase
MHTVAAARAWAVGEFKRARVQSPTLTADLLLGVVLGWTRVRVLSHTEDRVPKQAWIRLQNLVHRRIRGEPLQYLTGEKEFYGLVFCVTPEVLIPRPETEILVEKAIGLLRNHSAGEIRFADIGTGSGCIAISLLHEIPLSVAWAVDISCAALRIAHENAVRNQVADRILLIQADLLECFPRHPCFDFLLCNPPYVPLKEYDSLPSEVRDHEPHDALFGGDSGLEKYRRLVPEVSSRLVPGGYLLLELGSGQAEQVAQLVECAGFEVEMIENDLQGIPRCLVGRKFQRSDERNG